MLDTALVRLDEPAPPARPSVSDLSSECLAVRCPGVLSPSDCAIYAERVYGARAEWTANFGGKQFTLGRAWYTHLEEDRDRAYFAGAGASDGLVRAKVPGLQDRMLHLAAELLGGLVVQREGWCGPGVHIFPARGEVARRGGEVHFDNEGLTPAQIERRAPAMTFVLMLQRPEIGGGLRVWDRLYAGDAFPRKPDPHVPVIQVAYDIGELVVIDSYRLHQILPFPGRTDRITATVHAVLEGGRWEAWF